jgi:hypothetical protein
MMLALALLTMALPNEPVDAGWLRLLPDREDINNFEYHPGSVQRDGGLVRIWARNDILSYNSGTGQFVLDGRNVWLSEVDCGRNMIRQVSGIRRAPGGEPMHQQAPPEPQPEPQPIADGSIGHYLRQAACPATR